MKFALVAYFDASPVELNGESYLLIKRSDFALLFDCVKHMEVVNPPTAPALHALAPAKLKTRRQPRPQLQLNNGQPAPAGEEPSETPVSQTFADCVRIALRNVGPASISNILQDLTDSEIKTDRQKLTVCLARLKSQGEAMKYNDGKWSWRMPNGTTV